MTTIATNHSTPARAAFEWSVENDDSITPARLQGLAPETAARLETDGQPDLNALALLREAGLHFDQQALTDQPEQHQLVLTGEAAIDDLVLAMVDAVRDRHATLAVDATTTPLRCFEVASIASPMLVIASARGGSRQIPAEPDAVRAALRRAASEREPAPPTAPYEGTGDDGAPHAHAVPDPAREGAQPAPTAEDGPGVAHDPATGGMRRRLRGLTSTAAPTTSGARITFAALPISLGVAWLAGRAFGHPGRWLAGAAITGVAATAVATLLRRRRSGSPPGAAAPPDRGVADPSRSS